MSRQSKQSKNVVTGEFVLTYIKERKTRIILSAAFLMVLTSSMPWVNVAGTLGVSGLKGNGLYTLIASVILICISGISLVNKGVNISKVSSSTAFFSFLISGYTIVNLLIVGNELNSIYYNSVSVGEGAVFTFILSILILLLK